LGEVAEAKGELGPPNLARVLEALARLGHADATLVARLSEEVVAKTGTFDEQDVCNTLWSLLVLSSSPDHLAVRAVWDRLGRLPASALASEGLAQVHLAQLCLREEHPDWAFPALSADMMRAADAAVDANHAEAKSSKLHLAVSATLRELAVEHENEVVVGGLSVDIVVRDRRLVVEVDGPAHYGRNHAGARHMLGRYRFKHRLLRAQGWDVVCVPYFEWNALTTAEARGAYLEGKLPAAAF
jgi:very-short-patch-repair endonuclease